MKNDRSPSIVRILNLEGYNGLGMYLGLGETANVYRITVRKPFGKLSLGA
jgi:hypothetical protein